MVTLSFSKGIVKALEQELIRAHELNNLRLYKLAQGLLWIHYGKPWPVIAERLGVSVKTVENWLRRFLAQGLRWLRGQHYRGRGCKSRLTPEQKQDVKRWVKNGPQANGFSCGVWNRTTATIRAHVELNVSSNRCRPSTAPQGNQRRAVPSLEAECHRRQHRNAER
ncbi:MAG: helix-turn-helix domain-containing protein [Candidatus Competibacteraceae bacterium]|jgi:hypothetical protein|nr:helix-turn-helix domain-containing protein [Candidatus Competibacteraceae bacterium]